MESVAGGIGVIGLIVAGGGYAMRAFFHEDEKRAISIQANNNIIINVGAKTFNTSPREFADVIQSVVNSRKDQIAAAAVKIVKPAKRENVSIHFADEHGGCTINHRAVRAIPDHFTKDLPIREYSKKLTKTLVEIRALDVDKRKKGWGVRLPDEFGEKRIKLELSPDISPEELLGKKTVTADLTIYFKDADKKGQRPVSYAYLTKIYK